MSEIFVNSEVSPLQKVLVHRPDEGISRISPKRSGELLFDDIVYYPDMQKEHQLFVEVLEKLIGKGNVLFVEDLLFQGLEEDAESRYQMIEAVIDFEELPSKHYHMLADLDNKELTKVLISGYHEKEDWILFDPIPNFIFTRDIGVVINDHVLITKASKAARFRENFLTQFIFNAHSMFATLRNADCIINMNDVEKFAPSRRGEAVSIEGGDVMVINSDYLLVGCSERTTEHAIKCLRDELFDRNVISNVVQFNIPNDRSFMHIDTVFTIINNRDAVCYKPLVYDGLSSHVICYKKEENNTQYYSLRDFLYHEMHPEINFVFSGNGISPFQEREQWTDGCNLLTIRPGVAITYGRNVRTLEAFKALGYKILHSRELLKMKDTDSLEKTIISLSSAELSRARGGSHCMSFPLLREK